MKAEYFLGLDLGQRMDYTALAILERYEVPVGWPVTAFETKYCLRHMERAPLRTAFPEVVRRVREVARGLNVGPGATLVMDATGMGVPVVDLFWQASLECEFVPVVITSGEKARRDGREWHVPKRDLVMGVQMMLAQGELAFAKGLPQWDRLVEELMNLRVKVTVEGSAKYGGWKTKVHDDLALALGLACWRARDQRVAGFGVERLI